MTHITVSHDGFGFPAGLHLELEGVVFFLQSPRDLGLLSVATECCRSMYSLTQSFRWGNLDQWYLCASCKQEIDVEGRKVRGFDNEWSGFIAPWLSTFTDPLRSQLLEVQLVDAIYTQGLLTYCSYWNEIMCHNIAASSAGQIIAKGNAAQATLLHRMEEIAGWSGGIQL